MSTPAAKDGPVYVGLGANVGAVESTLAAAAEEISRLPGVTLLRRSSLYASAPVGPAQPEFRNAVIAVESGMDAAALLEALLRIERAHGRLRVERWGPRTLDLDLLLWGERVIDRPGLHIPHPQLHRRRFALEPLAELDSGARHPLLGKTVAELLTAVRDQPVERLSSDVWSPR